METMQLVRWDLHMPHELEDFEDILHSVGLTYHTNQLLLAGLEPGEIDYAVRKAIKVCRMNGVDPSDHFRSFYVYDEKNGNVYCDWRMTRQGFTLAVINAPHDNETIAQWQWKIVEGA